MQLEAQSYWRKCTSCKKEIPLGTIYWVCNVSTCNRKRTGLVFCSVSCWDAHVPVLNHRDSWAEERKSPFKNQLESEKIKMENLTPTTSTGTSSENDTLVVVSKLKNYIRTQSGMNTSGDVADILSDKVRILCDGAIENAKQQGRKTVMAKDF